MPIWKALSSAAEGSLPLGISFDGRSGSPAGEGLALGVGEALVVAFAVGVAVVVEVCVVVGDGTAGTLSTTMLTSGLASRLLDAPKPLTDSVCAPSGTEVESQRIADGGEEAR